MSFIYCTPFLDEIDRIRRDCGQYRRFSEPLPYNGTKIDDFNTLLSAGTDIAVTHTTFLNATPETLELIRQGDYTLIVDEALDVVQDFNNVQPVEYSTRQTITGEDVKFLLERGIIQIEHDNSVTWCAGEYGDDLKFSAVQRYAKLGRLYCVNRKLLLAVFPPEMFNCFKQVDIMTYLFNGSIFKYYLDRFGVAYETVSVAPENGKYALVPYCQAIETAFRQRCKELIHICGNASMNSYKVSALSKTWYENSGNDDRLERLKKNLSNYFRYYVKSASATNGDIMWTTFNDYSDRIKGHRYTRIRNMTEQERALPQAQRDAIEKELSCFVPCNAKATNIYRERWALAYCVNMYLNPMMRRFFTDANGERVNAGLPEIHPDEDAYAISCMLQWIFRSRIRDGQPIDIYIPNRRMRQLLTDWMEGKI